MSPQGVLELSKLVRERNHTLNQWEQFYRIANMQAGPLILNIPTGSRCNIRCRFCTEREGKEARSYYSDLSFTEFLDRFERGQLKEAAKTANVINLYGWGEPLINPDYEKIFDYIAQHFPNLGISICTNGIFFHEKWSHKISSVPNSEVNFSVNAATKETFLQLTKSREFDRMISNIRYLSTLRERTNTTNPYISLSYVATTESVHELPQFVELAAELKADSVLIQDVALLNEETEKLSLTKAPELAKKMFRLAEQRAHELNLPFAPFVTHQHDYFWKTLESSNQTEQVIAPSATEPDDVPSPYRAHTDCFDPWERFMVSEDGEVFPCCRSATLPDATLGNIKTQTFTEIWKGPRYREFRATVNTANPPDVCVLCARKTGQP